MLWGAYDGNATMVKRHSSRVPALFSLALVSIGVIACSEGRTFVNEEAATQLLAKPQPVSAPSSLPSSDVFSTPESTGAFLARATFGPTPQDIETLTGTSASAWFLNELEKPVNSPLEMTRTYRAMLEGATDRFNYIEKNANDMAFWKLAIEADDQLRQRVAFALSEIFVVSEANTNQLRNNPDAVGYYHDILVRDAFGNYRELLEDITYSPAMGYYLTYQGNRKADPNTGRMPDENYAREIVQLFSLGVVPLQADGTPIDGAPDLYGIEDIKGLAKVFTGLFVDRSDEDQIGTNGIFSRPMSIREGQHSDEAKEFLGTIIPPDTDAATSIDLALDTIASHPNVGPFISRQLIQRLVTSDPDPDYVARVANAFTSGLYTLPSGDVVGEGRRGDLAATVAAVLFDASARYDATLDDDRFGKIREPILRFTAWARAFNAGNVTPEYVFQLWDTTQPDALGQQAFRSPSVFNFFRPGYVAPGTLTGAQGMTVPELQITNATTIPGYVNYMEFFIRGWLAESEPDDLAREFGKFNIALDASRQQSSFIPDYATERALATDPAALVDHLNAKLTYGTMSSETRALIIEAISQYDITPDADWDPVGARVHLAILMTMASPEFLVQR